MFPPQGITDADGVRFPVKAGSDPVIIVQVDGNQDSRDIVQSLISHNPSSSSQVQASYSSDRPVRVPCHSC
eukprot:854926-Rhodomonas_salina.1